MFLLGTHSLYHLEHSLLPPLPSPPRREQQEGLRVFQEHIENTLSQQRSLLSDQALEYCIHGNHDALHNDRR